MTLRLNGSNSGFTEVKAPATAGSNTLTLPTSNGSANQYLRNGSTAGTLEFVTHRGFVTYAIICDQKATTTDGGTFTSGAWQTRDLNTEIADPDNIVSISSNQFTLGAGSYLITANAPAFDVSRHQARLYNATTSTSVQVGTSVLNDTGGNGGTPAILSARVTITGDTAFEIQHQCSQTKTSTGFGASADFDVEIYTTVQIFKEA